ncbi:PREDICTED: uncharacterized protein LOC108370693 [Rhagoletis zephyria]|uniref:uncharacterized protein LOC108370693 n=1 Tax=Rhagoletis zephyria TaxID=28612 RepID=UPI00081137EC|nr:PREDICTED: uncharacterized protein LOC108370693 [Rhagoletis zephyria]
MDKLLNKELINANRTLKQIISAYQTELVNIRAELMEQRRVRVEAEHRRKRVLEILSHNQTAQIMNSQSGIRAQSGGREQVQGAHALEAHSLFHTFDAQVPCADNKV